MKKSFQMIALLAVALLGACSGGKDKAVAEHVDEKPRVKLADVKARPVEQIHEYTAIISPMHNIPITANIIFILSGHLINIQLILIFMVHNLM